MISLAARANRIYTYTFCYSLICTISTPEIVVLKLELTRRIYCTRSEQCSDEYKLSGDEKPLWQTIDESTCKGAFVSQAFAVKWKPLSHPLPLGCPLKDVQLLPSKRGSVFSSTCIMLTKYTYMLMVALPRQVVMT